MKNLGILFSITLAGALFTGCGGKEESKNDDAPKSDQKQSAACTWSMNESKGLEIRWVAYKHTAKVPVEGSFVDYEILSKGGEGDIQSVLTNMEVIVYATKVSTQDESRDAKIVQFFFQIFKSPEIITGKITSVSGSDKMGSGTMQFNMNETNYSVPFDYVIRESGEIVTHLHH
jgi:hypothetical protein